ncbi:MBL fold metallo-hydrolase [Brevundimonas sp.]|uniref:MBL fold metallo-hydrolase n=1 Tax=Brevundimonas sp. TaxID=1871086 RepID=UPI0025F08B9D|nr:MBL fold metallo-hydrolase [Brevundimonas sp.]
MSAEFPTSALVAAPERLVLKDGSKAVLKLPVRYGLFLRNGRPALIDTGYTSRVTEGPRSLALKLYAGALQPRLQADGLMAAALAAHRFEPSDVSDVIITHFHADHVSGLRDLPNARFHASAAGYERLKRAGALGRLRHGVFFELLPVDFADRLTAFEAARRVEAPLGLGPAADLFGDGSVLAVDLPGHAAGHHGVLFAGDPPVLYAADAQWMMAAFDDRAPGLPASLVAEDLAAARDTDGRIRRFREAGGRVVLCHDPAALP